MTKLFSPPRFLAIYSGVLTIAFAVVVLTGFAESRQKQTFDEITVRRINIVEPDGTLRMVLSNKTDFPGIIIKGKETPHPGRSTAGMLFFNDEGTENGGLIFGGSKDKQGKVTSYGHLSFDQYEQDQVFSIDAEQENGQRTSELRMIDEPDHPITQDIEAASAHCQATQGATGSRMEATARDNASRRDARPARPQRGQVRCAASERCPRPRSHRDPSAARRHAGSAVSRRKWQSDQPDAIRAIARISASLLQQIAHQVDIRRPLAQTADHADHLPAVQRGVIHKVPD